MRCIAFGHFTRMAIWELRPRLGCCRFDRQQSRTKLAGALEALGPHQNVIELCTASAERIDRRWKRCRYLPKDEARMPSRFEDAKTFLIPTWISNPFHR